MPRGRTSTAAAQANAVMRRHPDCSEGRRRLVARSPHGHEQPVRTTDATGRGPQAPRSYGRYLVALYNTVHPHKALGYCSPREFRKQMLDSATDNAVGARRRPHESTMSADAVGSSPPAARSAETRSVWLDASAAVDHP